MFETNEIKQAVRERYAGHATRDGQASALAGATSCCGGLPASATDASTVGCCSAEGAARELTSEQLGYDAADLAGIPEGADLGLGCGNPLAMLELREGETVVDLGSGAGIDCFIAAKRVGPSGRVIGVDMTPEMLDRARRNARNGGYDNVEFRLGEIEHLPVADGTVDAIISNCVVNLVPDKQQVFDDAYRVLKPGGRLSLSDIVLLGDVPAEIMDSVEAYVACLSGAILLDDYLAKLRAAGFGDVRVEHTQTFEIGDVVADDLLAEFERHAAVDRSALEQAASRFASVRVRAVK